jgi:hypothetical protein
MDYLTATREERLNEVGTLPPCPFCGRLRVQRSDYVRCNPCGMNWLDGDDLGRNPQLVRWEKFMASQPAPKTRATGSYPTVPGNSGVSSAASPTK